MPLLVGHCSSNDLPVDAWQAAVEICHQVSRATRHLGTGPYGSAAMAVFGATSATRGLRLGRRRAEAARFLQVEEATFVRHWEGRIRTDVAAILAFGDQLLYLDDDD